MTSAQPTKSKYANANLITFVIVVMGVALLILYRIGIRAEGSKDLVWFLKLVGAQAVLYVFTCVLLLRIRETRSLLLLGLVLAALFRLSILFSPPYLSDDVYRYIWDGRVQAAGINPYRYIPADQSLAGLRDEKIYPKINRRDYARTIYPPVAEAIYFLTTRVSESVTWMRATMVGFEALAVWALLQLLASFKLPRQRVLIYAWHPLAVWEFAGNGHLDAIAIAFITIALLARRRNSEVATGVSLACAVLVKFFPLVLFPALYKRWGWRMPVAFAVTIMAAYVPYLSVGLSGALGFLPGYASERGIISGEQFFILDSARRLLSERIPTAAYLVFACLLLLLVSVWQMRNPRADTKQYLDNSLVIASIFLVLLAPHFAWYFAWLIPFLCLVPAIPVFYLTLASFILNLTWLRDSPNQVFAMKAVIFVPFLALSAICAWVRFRKGQTSFDRQ